MSPPLVLAAALMAPLHPLGNFTVNRYDGLVVAAHELRVDHVRDLAEIPAAQVLQGGADLTGWAGRTCSSAAGSFRITVDGRPVRATVRSATARTRPGQAGLPTIRLECALAAPLTVRDGGSAIVVHDTGAADRAGWHEITAAGDRTTLRSSDVPARSKSARLTSYPQDLLSSPLDQRTASLTVTPGGPPLAASPGTGVTRVLPRGAGRFTQAFTDLIGRRSLSPAFTLFALLLATVLGATHALAPGHGKTIMATQAVGRGRRSLRDVIVLGLTVTVTHTAGVLTLALLVASGSTLVSPAAFGWLSATSGVFVVAAGVTLLRRALGHRSHTHPHTHGHDHHHDMPQRGTVVLMGFAGGLLPSPSAVVVLLGAAAVGHAWFGLLLVLAYGLGLALTLVSIGVFITGAGRRLATRIPSLRQRLPCLPRLPGTSVPAGSALLVILLGLGLTVRSLSSVLGQ
ncbi:sulfite exporter TauE/SafE family protein [Actinoallomurus spadix]|uniref:Urease accessory protein UreH-like transmembrane domain-containing protein n=1 Tax=Actinoallomurus spadix TaxID=79912 RepID=A0ABN0VW43_9ACTN|nr:sulfite exporter TauE/SafE family protein [Actinoallomurus spadix]MCO5985833.1 sulfite exporter TauE/SafE family protein [Actinoallomurus spadix]